ncbi:MAG: hypothetical protein FJW94_09440 [Actinobacteria bacterium]|nr:hypothetical protein [Actinomycetota bacterium]
MSDDPECSDWRSHFATAVREVGPDVVLVHLGVSGDVVSGDDPLFLSDTACRARRSAVAEAAGLSASQGPGWCGHCHRSHGNSRLLLQRSPQGFTV